MKYATGFVLGAATVTCAVGVALLTGSVDRRLEQARKDRRRVVEFERRRRHHVRRTPARWPR